MTRSVARPSHLGAVGGKSLPRLYCWQLLSSFIAQNFFVLKTYPPLETARNAFSYIKKKGIMAKDRLLRFIA